MYPARRLTSVLRKWLYILIAQKAISVVVMNLNPLAAIVCHAERWLGRVEGGVLICCLPQAIRPLTTKHPFRDFFFFFSTSSSAWVKLGDGAPSLLLVKTPPDILRAQSRFSNTSSFLFFSFFLSPFLFRSLLPLSISRIAIDSSLLSIRVHSQGGEGEKREDNSAQLGEMMIWII